MECRFPVERRFPLKSRFSAERRFPADTPRRAEALGETDPRRPIRAPRQVLGPRTASEDQDDDRDRDAVQLKQSTFHHSEPPSGFGSTTFRGCHRSAHAWKMVAPTRRTRARQLVARKALDGSARRAPASDPAESENDAGSPIDEPSPAPPPVEHRHMMACFRAEGRIGAYRPRDEDYTMSGNSALRVGGADEALFAAVNRSAGARPGRLSTNRQRAD